MIWNRAGWAQRIYKMPRPARPVVGDTFRLLDDQTCSHGHHLCAPCGLHAGNPLIDDIEYVVEMEPERDSVYGHFATGDRAVDCEIEEDIQQRLGGGDTWAWCCLRVRAKDRRGHYGISPWLGACSYNNEAEYRNHSGYFEDQCAEALADLKAHGGGDDDNA